MKFSFESQQHRDDLAEELKDTDKSERKALLEEKKKTLKYVLAQHIKDFIRQNNKKRPTGDVSNEDVHSKEKVERREIVGAVNYSFGQEGPGEKYKVELEIVDISDQVPESLQIIYDMNRLLEVEYSFKDDNVSRGWLDADDDKRYYINRDSPDSIDTIVKRYLKMAEKENGEPLTKDDGTPIDSIELDKIVEQAKKDFSEFREKVTGGLMNSPTVFYHTIGAHTKGFESDWYNGDTMISKNDVKKKLRNRFPNNSDGTEIRENPLEIDENLISRGIFVHAGKLIYDDVLKPLMLIDGASPRFRSHMNMFKSNRMKDWDILGNKDEDNTAKALREANSDDRFGVQLTAKNPQGVHWLRIADQIFDPYHGRLIKVRDVDETIQQGKEE